MQGIYVSDNGVTFTRPKSKKAIKELVAADPSRVSIEATSLHGNEYDGPVSDAPVGKYLFVGPDPYTSRKFYGTLTIKADGKVVVS